MKPAIVAGCIALTLGACASKEAREAEQAEAMPVNCRTAEGDLRMLRSEKATVTQHIAQGVSAIAPVGLLIGVATQAEGDKINMAIGEYNKIIEAKIDEIERKCGVR